MVNVKGIEWDTEKDDKDDTGKLKGKCKARQTEGTHVYRCN